MPWETSLKLSNRKYEGTAVEERAMLTLLFRVGDSNNELSLFD